MTHTKFEEIAQKLGKNITDTIIFLIEDAATKYLADNLCPALVELSQGYPCALNVPEEEPIKLGSGSFFMALLNLQCIQNSREFLKCREYYCE